jgi:hypothetical protein
VSGFALYPLSILIGVHNDAGLAPQPRGRPHHAPVNSSISRMFQILLRLGLSVAFEDHIHDGRAVSRTVCYDRTRPIAQGRSPDWLKSKNPACAAVKREEEEDWGR